MEKGAGRESRCLDGCEQVVDVGEGGERGSSGDTSNLQYGYGSEMCALYFAKVFGGKKGSVVAVSLVNLNP